MEPIFDIGFVTEKFSVTNISHYFNLLKPASNAELKTFKKQVIAHKKKNNNNIAFSNVTNLTTHQAIIKAINHELLKRSWRYNIFTFIYPIRKFLVDSFTHLELSNNEVFGVLYTEPKYPKGGVRITHNEIYKIFSSFWNKNWKYLITTIIAVTFGVLHYFK